MPITPVYGIQYPDRNTKLRQLGDELKQLALDIENALEQGAAPAPVDTGWVPINLANGYSALSDFYLPQWRRIGQAVFMRGMVVKDSGPFIVAPELIVAEGSLPADARPSVSIRVVTTNDSFSNAFGLAVYSNGGVQVRKMIGDSNVVDLSCIQFLAS